jgi:hypothetical protein
MNIGEELERLKDMLEQDEDFHAITQQFLKLTDSYKFMELGKLKKNKLLEAVIKQSLSDLNFPGTFVLKAKYIRKLGFYHGSFFTTPEFMPGSIFFFEDISMGMIAISSPSGKADYFRFTGAMVSPECFPTFKRSEQDH